MSNRVKQFVVSLAATAALIGGGAGPARAQQITLDGATGMLPLAHGLVQAFRAKNGATPLEVGKGNSSASALRAVADGRLAVGLSSVPLGEQERAAGLHSVEIARVAVVFAVNTAVKLDGLTTQQVCDIYAGKVRNWKEIGGPDLPVLPLSRPAAEADPQIVRQHLPCFREAEGVLMLPKAADMERALASKAGAIGFSNLTLVEDSRGAIRALALNGTSPAPETVRSGSYPLIRRFFLVTKGPPAGPVAFFVAFVKSPEGQRVIQESKSVPVQ